jgi:hypothetical protein
LTRFGAHTRALRWQAGLMSRREPPPTSRQINAIARALAVEAGLPWPATRAEASALIQRLRERAR